MTTLPSLEQLPEVFTLDLTQMSAISLSGEEKSHYLQGQVTCDVLALPENKLLTGAHCNAKGKVLGVFRLFEHQDNLMLMQPKTVIETSLKELQKFGVFAKVDITLAQDINFFAIAGTGARNEVAKLTSIVPDNLTPVIYCDDFAVIYLSGAIDRFVIASTKGFSDIIPSNLEQLSSSVWQLLEINDGFPHLALNHVEQYVPQMLNLQAIGAISFNKGCYLGQETVARMQYLGKNKRALFSLIANSDIEIPELSAIEQQMGDNWRKAGDVLAYYQASDGNCYIQSVLANDIEQDTALRSKEHTELNCTIKPLPYSLT